jgi:LPS-assembly protein
MMFSFRRKPLALLICCGFAGTVAGSLVSEVQAQDMAPLRVDPLLLGLPPLKPAEVSALPALEKSRAEVKTVDVTPVEPRADTAQLAKPAAPAKTIKATAGQIPARAVAPQPAPVVATPSRAPAPAETASPVVAAPARDPREEQSRAAPAPAALGAHVASPPSPGLAPSFDTLPPMVAATGPRDEEEVPADLPVLSLRASSALLPPPSKSEVPRPAFLSAERMSGTTDREAMAEGAAELRKIGTVVDAERMTYWPIDDELEAVGKVRLVQGDDVMTGPKMRLKLEEQVGFFEQPTYSIRRQSAVALEPEWGSSQSKSSAPRRKTTEGHGQAERIDFEGVNQIRLKNATYTTCKPGNEDWYATASDLKLDYDREVATGSSGAVYFKDVPILYTPWMSFSLNNNRKSGLLSPTFGSTSKGGLELTLPYYWNIAPNMDATIAPRSLSKRGTQLGSEFRYLGESYSGEARAEVLPNDKVGSRDRFAYSLQHAQTLGYGFSGAINYNRVSDDTYFTDLSSRITNTSQSQLLQQGVVSYSGGGWWNATANVQAYQTLQPDPLNLVAEPYRLKPQLTINARQPDLYRTDSSLFGQFTSFTNPTLSKPEARRTVLYPQIAIPLEMPGWYVTPKIGVHATHYSLDRQLAGAPGLISRTMPITSLDSGMTFERPGNWFGRDYTQTLEPRLYYLKIPYRDQSNIPVFDSGLADFNFAQIFSENQFSGQDRINDANQLTAAVTSRLIDPASGSEMLRAMVGQRFYFANQQVTLPNQNKQVWDRSDFLGAVSGQVLPKVYADAAAQYNAIHGNMQRFSLGGRYVPEPGKVLNVAYRFNRDLLKQVDVSAQWPLFGGWHAVGRMNYSIKDRQPIENIAGLEYNGGCWVVRVVGQRLATTTETASTAVFVQLELNDFSQIGSNPLDLLKRSIQGYGRVNQSTSDPVFGQ